MSLHGHLHELGLALGEAHEGHEICEGFLEPEIVPPVHGHEVSEPHVRQLVQSDVGQPEPEGICHLVGWLNKHIVVGYTPRIFHAANSEFGEEDLIILGERVLDTEELLIVLHADLCDSQHLLGIKVRGLALTGIDSHWDPWVREIRSESFELSRHHTVDVGRNGRRLLEAMNCTINSLINLQLCKQLLIKADISFLLPVCYNFPVGLRRGDDC